MATIKISKTHYAGKGYVVTFGWEGEPLPEGTEKVNLSRHAQNPQCWFTPDQVAMHDSHTPLHETEADADAYIKRVQQDVDSVLTLIEEPDSLSVQNILSGETVLPSFIEDHDENDTDEDKQEEEDED